MESCREELRAPSCSCYPFFPYSAISTLPTRRLHPPCLPSSVSSYVDDFFTMCLTPEQEDPF